ncbi:hypothetical protein [Litoribrevibacter albus]|uniref:Uncharacterized protein n=1 Tax=Litoribrevibacter albus TaxID=1473156 RepID=A0AA37S601_9GAMM|nr:hypothetical protein [Litoribrevibacter albus]GLQ29850.1 hypothetical protein GCM10007876_03280 [Litoribrevibacter albus]
MDFPLTLRRWTDKASADLSELYAALSDQPDFENRLIESLNGDEDIHRVTTWLIKHHLEQKHVFSDEQVACVFDQLGHLSNWEAKLHVLQLLPHVSVPERYKDPVEDFIRNCLSEINKFVRAWAYNGFYELACQYPELQPEAEILFEMASEDEAASVKARVSNIQKQGFPETLTQAS